MLDKKEAQKILDEIAFKDIIIKIGYSLFIKYGKDIVEYAKSKGFSVFLDLKLHDIPNTVYNGVLSAIDLGVDYLTVHTLGGKYMLEKAVEAKSNSNLKLLGVTVLTSHSEDYVKLLETRLSLKELAEKLAKLAVDTGIDGIVCSADEVEHLKQSMKRNLITVVPGIRPEGYSSDDQKRVATPKEAVKSGADIIVIGRPIIKADNKNEVIKKILEEIK